MREKPRREMKVAGILQELLESEDEDITEPRTRRTGTVKSVANVRAETPEAEVYSPVEDESDDMSTLSGAMILHWRRTRKKMILVRHPSL
jgi:hypothetical protein